MGRLDQIESHPSIAKIANDGPAFPALDADQGVDLFESRAVSSVDDDVVAISGEAERESPPEPAR
jgi:hypothetical protein